MTDQEGAILTMTHVSQGHNQANTFHQDVFYTIMRQNVRLNASLRVRKEYKFYLELQHFIFLFSAPKNNSIKHNPNMLQLNLVVNEGEASRLPSRERWQRWNKLHPLLFSEAKLKTKGSLYILLIECYLSQFNWPTLAGYSAMAF